MPEWAVLIGWLTDYWQYCSRHPALSKVPRDPLLSAGIQPCPRSLETLSSPLGTRRDISSPFSKNGNHWSNYTVTNSIASPMRSPTTLAVHLRRFLVEKSNRCKCDHEVLQNQMKALQRGISNSMLYHNNPLLRLIIII